MLKLYTTVGIIETGDDYDKNKYVLHREDGPAFIYYNNDGSILFETWHINGVMHREDGPAFIKLYHDGSIHWEEWYINGVKHREDGPAYIKYNNDNDGSIYQEEWYWCGMTHRNDYTQPSYRYDDIYEYRWYGMHCEPEELLDKDFRDRIALRVLG